MGGANHPPATHPPAGMTRSARPRQQRAVGGLATVKQLREIIPSMESPLWLAPVWSPQHFTLTSSVERVGTESPTLAPRRVYRARTDYPGLTGCNTKSQLCCSVF